MKRLVFALTAVLAAVSTAPAVPPLTMTVIGSLQTGGLRDEDPRIAEINAFDASGQRVYVVNPDGGVLDVIDISTPESPLKLPSLDIVAACEAALGAAVCSSDQTPAPRRTSSPSTSQPKATAPTSRCRKTTRWRSSTSLAPPSKRSLEWD